MFHACLTPVVQFCKISSGCQIQQEEALKDFTIVYGDDERRQDTTTQSRADIRELKLKGQTMHVDTLRRLIPSNTAKWQM